MNSCLCCESHGLSHCGERLRLVHYRLEGICHHVASLKDVDLKTNRMMHYDDVIMDTIASQITSLTIVYSIVYSGTDQRKHQSSASLAFVRWIHRGPVNSPHKGPVMLKIFHLMTSSWWRNKPWNIIQIWCHAGKIILCGNQGPLLLPWLNFNPSTVKQLHAQKLLIHA